MGYRLIFVKLLALLAGLLSLNVGISVAYAATPDNGAAPAGTTVASDIKKHVHFGVQPMAYPLAFISASMLHDRILRAELTKLGFDIQVSGFKKGNDMVQLIGSTAGADRFDITFMGDMPTVNTLLRTPSYLLGLGKRNFSSIVSQNFSRLEELKGKRIAYSYGSSSHLVLLRGLKAENVQPDEVTMVQMEPIDMPDALEAGSIDAYSAWEPTPTVSLERNPKNRAIYRGISTDWVVISRHVVDAYPEAALQLTASMARAFNWMHLANANTEQVARWVMMDEQAFSGKASVVSLSRAVAIARKDLLDVPGAPTVPLKIDGVAPLTHEFDFLQQQGSIPATANPKLVAQAFSYRGLKQVQTQPQQFRLFVFDYDH